MHMLKKTGLSLVIALSLVACSSDKNEETAGTKESTPSAKQEVVFQELLSHVPANTAYLIANNERVPEKVVDAHIDRMKTFFASMESMFSSNADDAEKTSQEKFALALFDALGKDISVETWKKNGLVANAHSIIYGLDLKPVARMEIASKDAFKAMIAKAETDSGHKVAWESCAGVDCLQLGEKEQKVVFALTDKQLIVTYHDGKNVEALFDHIAGKSKPESAFKAADWKGFVAENNYSGYGAGFLKVPEMLNQIETFAKAEAMKEEGEAFDEAAFSSCFGVAKKHAEHAQELVFGTKAMDEKRIDYEVLLKTTPEVSAVLKGLPNNNLQGFKSTADPIFNFGLNINFANMRDALSQYINFIATTGEELKCDSINPDELRKSIGGLSMAMAMGLGQFKAISVAVDNVEMDEATGQPKKVEAFATVMADDPMGLLQMLAMVNPVFATLEVPADGTVVPLPEGMLPPNPVVPTLSLSRKDQSLNILVGNDKPALQDIELAKSTFMWGRTDNQRYYSLLGGVMGNMPQGASDAETQEALKLMQSMGDISGKVSYQMGADDRGLLINYQINY